MDAISNAFFADPLYYVGFLVAFAAAIAFLTFLRGFLSGTPHFFTISTNADHQDHYRYYVTRGVSALLGLIVLWETIRIVASWFGIGAAAPYALLTLVILYVVFGVILAIIFAVKKSIVEHH